jgi:hypothetical protein
VAFDETGIDGLPDRGSGQMRLHRSEEPPGVCTIGISCDATADASCQPVRRVEAGASSGAVGTFVSRPPEPLLPAAPHVYQATAEVGSMGVTKLLLRKIHLERNLT